MLLWMAAFELMSAGRASNYSRPCEWHRISEKQKSKRQINKTTWKRFPHSKKSSLFIFGSIRFRYARTHEHTHTHTLPTYTYEFAYYEIEFDDETTI